MYEFSNIIPSSWDSESTLHKLFPYDKIDSITIRPYPMIGDGFDCLLHVIIQNNDIIATNLDIGLASSYLEDYLSDLNIDYDIEKEIEEDANLYKFIVKIKDFENHLLEKISITKSYLEKLTSSLDSLANIEYNSIYDDFPGWSNGKKYMTLTEKVPLDLIKGSANIKVKNWMPSDWTAFKESVKNFCLGKPVCDQNPINLISIGDDYYVGSDGFNRVCAAKYLDLSYVSAVVDSYNYESWNDYDEINGNQKFNFTF